MEKQERFKSGKIKNLFPKTKLIMHVPKLINLHNIKGISFFKYFKKSLI
jgi:hypothetical protein